MTACLTVWLFLHENGKANNNRCCYNTMVAK